MSTFDKFTTAKFAPCQNIGFTWVETAEQEDSTGDWYSTWLLSQGKEGRVIAYIDGPTKTQICYGVYVEGQSHKRMYLSLEGAQRYALSASVKLIGGEQCESARRRKMRHESRK